MASPGLARVARFSLVGVCVALIYGVLFLWLRELGLARWVASTVAFAVAVLFQYVAQTWWTFGARPGDGGAAIRFAAMVGTGALLAAAITGLIGPALGASDAVSAAAVVVTLPVFNYVTMSVWVYRGRAGTRERKS